MSYGLAVAGWCLIVQALGLALGLPGLHALPRRAPRWLGAPVALAAAVCWSWAVVVSLGWSWTWLVPAALPTGVAAGIGLCVLVPRRPSRPFLPGGGAAGWTSTEVPLAGDADAGALHLAPAGASDGATVVWVHGGGNDRLYGLWHLAQVLLSRGHHVFVANLPGHGKGGSDPFTLRSCRRRLDGLIDAARERVGERPLVLVGQSLGGAVCLDRLALSAAGIDSVVTISAPFELELGARAAADLRGLLSGSSHRALAFGNPWEVLPAGGRFKRGAFPVRLPAGGPASYVEAFVEAVVEMRLLDRLDGLGGECPVLLAHGARDSVIHCEQARLLAEVLGRGAELWVFPRVAHLDPLFDEQLVQQVVGWVDAVELLEEA
jgi:pimeloyl-ACP methyl ester carboxylesterase